MRLVGGKRMRGAERATSSEHAFPLSFPPGRRAGGRAFDVTGIP